MEKREHFTFYKILRIFLVLNVVGFTESGRYMDDVLLSAREKDTLDRFKAKIIPQVPKSSYIQNYIKDDLYWIRWLRSRNLNIEAAEQAVMTHLKWRQDEKIDTIDEEDWEDFQERFPMFFDGTDKEGRPIVEMWIGDYNVRQAVISGESKKLLRYGYRSLELQNRRIYAARAAGRQVSQMVLIGDMQGFNIAQSACAACLPLYLTSTLDFERNYPGFMDTAFMVNNPPAFDIILRIVRPVLSPANRRALQTYSYKSAWLPLLNARIAKNQRSVRLGGTVVRDID